MAESPKYHVKLKSNGVELREYAPYIKAQVRVSESTCRGAIYKGFGILADYIFGNNISAEKVTMTRPVQVEESRKIAMTVPVTVSGRGTYTVAFVMPSEFTLETLPRPKTDAIHFVEVPAQTVAAIRTSSFYNLNEIEKAKHRLETWVRENSLKPVGDFITAGYNPPWVPSFLARSEVLLQVEAVSQERAEASGVSQTTPSVPDEQGSVRFGIDSGYHRKEGEEVIYLAGGCFWGLEKLMQSLPGVVDAVSGYANGRSEKSPTYQEVCTGNTGYRETVRVVYKPAVISLDAILFAYFQVIDPTVRNQQGNDIGTQYQTGVYYSDEAAKAAVERVAAIERERAPVFAVEIGPLERFYEAEEYHQNYLDKNPNGYCHISRHEMKTVSAMVIDPGKYPRPSLEQIRANLTEAQYKATQLGGTERAFSHPYYENKARGIYADVVTGEPLFSSADKFQSGTGWPSFTKPIDINAIRELEDNSHGMRRIEIRSRAGNSHLGHVFYNDPLSPNGVRYCVNGASLLFVPFEELEAGGYGDLKRFVG